MGTCFPCDMTPLRATQSELFSAGPVKQISNFVGSFAALLAEWGLSWLLRRVSYSRYLPVCTENWPPKVCFPNRRIMTKKEENKTGVCPSLGGGRRFHWFLGICGCQNATYTLIRHQWLGEIEHVVGRTMAAKKILYLHSVNRKVRVSPWRES